MSDCDSCYGTGEYQTARGWSKCPHCGGSGKETERCETLLCSNLATGDGPYPELCFSCGRNEHNMIFEQDIDEQE